MNIHFLHFLSQSYIQSSHEHFWIVGVIFLIFFYLYYSLGIHVKPRFVVLKLFVAWSIFFPLLWYHITHHKAT